MFQIKIVGSKSIHNEPNPTFVPNAVEVFSRTGLWLLVKSLSYFGFKLSESPRSHCCLHRSYVAFLLTATVVSLTLNCYTKFPLIVNEDGNFDPENAGFYMLMAGGYLVASIIFCLGIINARHYTILFRSLASAVDQVNDSERRQKFVQSVKRTFLFWSFSCYVITAVLAISSFQQGENSLHDLGKTPITTPFFSMLSNALNLGWFITLGQFYFFTSLYLSIACKMINFLLEVYLSPEVNAGERAVDDIWNDPQQKDELRANEMSQKLINHQKLSQIVEQANSAFTHFLFFTLTIETLVFIAFVKLLTIKNGTYSIVAYAYAFHIAIMLWKVFICGNVNAKLKTSLIFKKLPYFYQYSNDQVSTWILYLEEQNISRSEITYGNIFPIKKTFIFTIMGTVLTYAMVLHGM